MIKIRHLALEVRQLYNTVGQGLLDGDIYVCLQRIKRINKYIDNQPRGWGWLQFRLTIPMVNPLLSRYPVNARTELEATLSAFIMVKTANVEDLFIESPMKQYPRYPKGSFSQLKHLGYKYTDHDVPNVSAFEGILKGGSSLTSFEVENVCRFDTLPWIYDNLTDVLIYEGPLENDCLRAIMLGVKNLKCFLYESYLNDTHEPSKNQVSRSQKCDALLLQRHALKELSLNLYFTTWDSDEYCDFFDDLQNMNVLEWFEIHSSDLYYPPDSDGDPSDDEMLTNLLPHSIRQMRVLEPGKPLQRPLQRLLQSLPDGFPNLREIHLVGGFIGEIEWRQHICNALLAKGVKCLVYGINGSLFARPEVWRPTLELTRQEQVKTFPKHLSS